MENRNLYLPKKVLPILFILLLSVVGMTKVMAQTPYRQYADNGILLDFHEIDNVDFRVFLLYNLNQDDRFVLTAEEDNGVFYIGSSDESLDESFFDTFEDIYNLSYTDFQILSKLEITDLYPVWKSGVDPRFFTSMMMDITLRNTREGENETCLNADPFCTSDFYEFESATTSQTADQLEGHSIEDGCIGLSYNPSWYYLRIADSGPLTIHMEGHDPDNPSTQRDIDFCLWGPFTEEQMNTGYACSHLTSNMIIDCNYSSSYLENAYMGYPEGEHVHNTGHGTVNYHVPQTGEYYLLMITNYSRQPCVITFNKPEGEAGGTGTTDCSILPPIVNNDGPYCVGETIHLYAPGISGASYSWTGPNNYRSRFQNVSRPNCTMAMAGPYICTITRNGQSASDTTWVEVYPNVNADFTATNVDVGPAIQFNSTSTTNPTGYSISSYEWDFGDGQTGSGATVSHTFTSVGTYTVTHIVSTGDGHCTDEITQEVIVNDVASLDVPQHLTASNTRVFEYEETVTLSWDQVDSNNDFTYRRYRVYKDGVPVYDTPDNVVTTSWDIPQDLLTYNMYNEHGYVFNVTAVYDEGESPMSNPVEIWVSGNGNVSGTAYEQDGVTPIGGVTVTIQGFNEFNAPETYTFVTDENGYYEGAVHAGTYPIPIVHKEGYQDAITIHPIPFLIVYQELTDHVDFIMDEVFYAPSHVCTEPFYVLGVGNIVQVWWDFDFDRSSFEDLPKEKTATRSLHHYNIYRTECSNNGPYTDENTAFLATVWCPDTSYFDVSWPEAPVGVYKWGVSAVYRGNQADNPNNPRVEYPNEGRESEIVWSDLCGPCVSTFEDDINHWTSVGEGQYPFSMTLYGVIAIDGIEQTNNQLELGVFCGNECRGTAMVSEFFLTHRYLAEVNVYGDSGDQLIFKLYDHATHQELDLTPPAPITFTIDGYGNPINPYVLNFTSSVNITATTAPEGAGTVTGTGEYTIGSTCTLTATANTGFQFQNWTLNGTVVSTSPNYSFTVRGAANYVAHFQYVQSRTLVSGWNWWSTYIEQNGSNGLEMLENSLGTSGIRIQGKNNSVDYFEYQGTGYWYGSLNTLTNEQMYMIRTSAACDAVIVGDAALPSNHPITINGGWNWIGYPYSQSVSVDAAMAGFTPEPNDVIKGRSNASMYLSYGGYQGWYGQLNTLEPGQGYMYRSYSDATKTLRFQTGRGGETLANVTPEGNVFVPNTDNYADNMIVTAVIDMEGTELRSEDYELAAFAGNECRGSVKLIYVEPYDRYVALLMAYGEGGEELRFVLTDGEGTSWSNDRVTYTANGMLGTMTEPTVLHFGPMGTEDNLQKPIHIYPNPSTGIFNIEGDGLQKIEVIDIYGQVILSKEIKNTNLQVDLSDKAAGAYLLRVVTVDGIVTHKLIKDN